MENKLRIIGVAPTIQKRFALIQELKIFIMLISFQEKLQMETSLAFLNDNLFLAFPS